MESLGVTSIRIVQFYVVGSCLAVRLALKQEKESSPMPKKFNGSKRELFYVFSKLVPISIFFEDVNGAIYCPFHDDVRHPSAKIYFDDTDNTERLYCFAERKQYTSFHFVLFVLKQDCTEFLFSKNSQEEVDLALESLRLTLSRKTDQNGQLIEGIARVFRSRNDFQGLLNTVVFGDDYEDPAKG